MSGAHRIEVLLHPEDLHRFRSAARIRRLTLARYIVESTRAQADEDLASRRFEADPYERRAVDTFADPPR